MLFNIYYDGDSPADFRIDLTENLLIKPNSSARLLKCFIPHAKSIIMTSTKIMDLIVNDSTAAAIPINIPAIGNIDIQTLVTQINTAINTALVAPDDNVTGSVSYDITKGHNTGAFTIRFDASTLYFNTVNNLDWSQDPYDDAGFLIDIADPSVIANNVYTKLGSNGLNAQFKDNLGSPVTDGSFSQATIMDSYLKVDRYEETDNKTLDYPPSTYEEYGNFAFTVGADRTAEGATFFVGATTSATDTFTDGVANSDVGVLENMDDLEIIIFVPGKEYLASSTYNTSTTKYSANGLYIYERDDVANLHLVVSGDDAAIADGDVISYVVSVGEYPEYYIKRGGVGDWLVVPVIPGSPRGTVYANERFYPAISIYTATTDDKEILSGFTGSIIDGKYSDYGQYIGMDLTQDFADSLGFTALNYVEYTTGTENLARLIEDNDKSFAIVEASADCPFVNINIPNLPLKGFINYDTARVGLSNAPTLGVVSRFDQNGSLEAIESLYVDFPTHTVQMDNSNPLSVSQLHFQLRDSDGKIPLDLGVPLGIVFEITESR